AKVPEGGVLAQCSACPGTFFVEQPQVQASPEQEEDAASWLEAVGSDTEAAQAPESDSPWLEAPDVEATEDPQGVEPAASDDSDVEFQSQGSEHSEGEAEDQEAPAFAALNDDSEVEAGFEEAEAFTPFDDDGASHEAGEEESSEPETAVATAPVFGQSDPDARAARLARVLVSDMMTYNPALYEKAMESGTLAEDFEDEVKKSWSEYVDQVGDDIARSTPHFTRALNDILAKGEEVFQESMYE
ncbi:MAG: hypothetical protein HKN73_15245, partial [Gemmatimonadetes bacterium]|nr:hypothetical protein [Gemmatimonadota bacterium]